MMGAIPGSREPSQSTLSRPIGFDPGRIADVLHRLELVRAWKQRGGPMPAEKMPSTFHTVDDAIQLIKELCNA